MSLQNTDRWCLWFYAHESHCWHNQQIGFQAAFDLPGSWSDLLIPKPDRCCYWTWTWCLIAGLSGFIFNLMHVCKCMYVESIFHTYLLKIYSLNVMTKTGRKIQLYILKHVRLLISFFFFFWCHGSSLRPNVRACRNILFKDFISNSIIYQAGSMDWWQFDIVVGRFKSRVSRVSEPWLAGVDGWLCNLLSWVTKGLSLTGS